MMPPKTPVSIDGIPMIGVVSTPRAFAHTPIAARNTNQPTVPASAETPSFSVSPIATPMAKSNGRLLKIAPPDCAMTCETMCGSHEKFALPTPRRIPATGNTETGSIMHLPIFCREEKALLKSILVSVFRLEGANLLHGRAVQSALRELATTR
jgi:hypothetical protein